jgi:hypothetical protein
LENDRANLRFAPQNEYNDAPSKATFSKNGVERIPYGRHYRHNWEKILNSQDVSCGSVDVRENAAAG